MNVLIAPVKASQIVTSAAAYSRVIKLLRCSNQFSTMFWALNSWLPRLRNCTATDTVSSSASDTSNIWWSRWALHSITEHSRSRSLISLSRPTPIMCRTFCVVLRHLEVMHCAASSFIDAPFQCNGVWLGNLRDEEITVLVAVSKWVQVTLFLMALRASLSHWSRWSRLVTYKPVARMRAVNMRALRNCWWWDGGTCFVEARVEGLEFTVKQHNWATLYNVD